ncbi:MAG: endolytic transglycosylase MltG [Proteobacteria bacterium]|nr:endolytic transglycosylase MltG [Pseudomonadota bacterium]MDE3208736.1 endolytic transglycosylase MltG [Pseudomonadota bacterium]
MKRKRSRQRLFRFGYGKVVLLCVFLLVAWYVDYLVTPLPLRSRVFIIQHDSSLREVSEQLVQQGVLPQAWPFTLLMRLQGRSASAKAGNYALDDPVTPWRLSALISEDDPQEHAIHIIDGWTFRQMRALIDSEAGLVHETKDMSNSQLMKAIGASGPPEGEFMPDVYHYLPGMNDLQLYRRAWNEMQSELDSAWKNRAQGLPYQTPYDALIMASLIEKETANAKERPIIAGVFLNRLHLNMKLQTDPTVIYGMGSNYHGVLTRSDLKQDTPYNTYVRYGLPPTPIALPCLDAILAALHPAKTQDLYFVSRGNGTHQFSRTLAQQISAINHYEKGSK